jgi:hypothetical protein
MAANHEIPHKGNRYISTTKNRSSLSRSGMVTIGLIVKSHRSCSCLSDEAACGSMRPGADQRNYSKSMGVERFVRLTQDSCVLTSI